VDQFLKRHGFINKKEEDPQEQDGTLRRNCVRTTQGGSARSPARSQPRQALERDRETPAARDARMSGRQNKRLEEEYPKLSSQMPPPQPALSTVGTPLSTSTPNNRNRRTFEDSGLAGDEDQRGRLTVESSGKRHKWIEDIVAVRFPSEPFIHSHLVFNHLTTFPPYSSLPRSPPSVHPEEHRANRCDHGGSRYYDWEGWGCVRHSNR
jgi:hypothetical protein